MNESSKKKNILDKRKVIAIVVTLVVMIPFIISQYLSPFGSSLKYRLDNLPIYKWICSQPFALNENGYITMHSGFPKYGFLGDLQELITAIVFLLLILLVYFLISKSLYFILRKSK